MLPLEGHVALVTGASSGIGAAIARELGRAGAAIAINHLDAPQHAELLAAEIRALGRGAIAVQADVTARSEVEGMIEAIQRDLGPISVLINNVGGLVERRAIDETDDALYERVMALNFKSAYLCVQAVLPGMRRAGGGRIVNVSSIAAETGGTPGSVIYAAAKGAMNALTIGLAHELAPQRIRVNAVAPGLIDTPFHSGAERAAFSQRIAAIPLGRIGEPEDVARVVGFLASDQSRYMTGQIVTIAGGR